MSTCVASRAPTGARDGRILLWDARCCGSSSAADPNAPTQPTDAPTIAPVWSSDANVHGKPGAPGAAARSAMAASPVTVTSVAFVPHSYLLASGGACDTTVRLWDMRMAGLPLCELEPVPAGEPASRATHVTTSAELS
jgi:denticleless